jgi:signal peptidase I
LKWIPITVGIACIAVVLPVTILLVSAWLLGWQLQVVQSGSMAPPYSVGSLLVVQPIDASDVEVGMAIVFEDPQTEGLFITHRVVGRVSGTSLQFWTQGDANPTRDPYPVAARFIRGRVKWHVEGLGFIATWLRWPRSFLLLVVLPTLWLGTHEWRTSRDRIMTSQ